MMRPSGEVYCTWDDIKDTSRNLAIFELYVFMLDFILLKPTLWRCYSCARVNAMLIIACWFSSQSVLSIRIWLVVLLPKSFFISLVFIIGIVTIRFVVAVMFQWFFSWKLGNLVHATFRRDWKLVQQYLPPCPEPVLSQHRQRWPAKKGKLQDILSQYFYVHTLRGFLQRIGWTTKNSTWHALFLAQSRLEALNHVWVFTPSD